MSNATSTKLARDHAATLAVGTRVESIYGRGEVTARKPSYRIEVRLDVPRGDGATVITVPARHLSVVTGEVWS